MSLLIPFIFLTAKADRQDTRLGMDLGADDYISKPFTYDEVISAINTRLKKEASRRQKHEEKLSALRSHLISALPHEMRTPLTSVVSTAELMLLDARPDSEAHTMLNMIYRGGKRLQRLIENYLFYIQLELLQSEPTRLATVNKSWIPANLANEIVGNVALAQAELWERQADLTLALDNTRSVQISLDSLKKIVEELIDNAFKFFCAGMPVQVITSAEGTAFVLTIQHSGRGMRPEQIKEVGASVIEPVNK